MKNRRCICCALVAVLSWASTARANVTSDLRGIDVRLKACMAKDDSNAGMNACTADAYKASDRVLNGIYKGQVAKLDGGSADDKETLKRLVASERSWVMFRDADCDLQGTSMLGGSGEGLAIVDCLYAKTKERVKSLDDLFNAER